ncbi:hypothetical protein A2881_00635 [Candidatus Peribacteria bacterium RIFCSPHIGHO2_01_FULL_55_13]|nr:MAG: hypothetical protein A2881_00635 [Candidatus Peribacteria bacterium RIFCSPHIGHO2_01_FULL_55_13]
MSNHLYADLAEICHLFYKLYFPHEVIADIADAYLKKYQCKKILFFGGCIYVAEILQKRGYAITFVDYTPEMLAEAKKVLTGMEFLQSDMRTIATGKEYDAILLIGRIFTYLHTDADVHKTLEAFAKNLRPGGIALVDNYETGKIDADHYFNGTVSLKGDGHEVRRISTMKRVQEAPALYAWDCVYEDHRDGQTRSFTDNGHMLRALSKPETEELIRKSPLTFLEHAKNFEERSFMTAMTLRRSLP